VKPWGDSWHSAVLSEWMGAMCHGGVLVGRPAFQGKQATGLFGTVRRRAAAAPNQGDPRNAPYVDRVRPQ
jgi:hypothetical protein